MQPEKAIFVKMPVYDTILHYPHSPDAVAKHNMRKLGSGYA